jgi:hypothetical protein
MAKQRGSAALMKIGIIVAAVVITVRIVLEQSGAPEYINNIFGVAWLYVFLPILFAWSIVHRGEARWFRVLLKDLFFFALYTRLMVMFTYMLAYLFGWEAPRFSTAMGGNVGDNMNVVRGLLVIPVRNALIWIMFAVVIGLILGAITVWLKKKSKYPVMTI